jgi:polyisoprenoid-binding protein YceI
MTFKSFKVLPAEQTVEGELTIKGVTKTVAFEVEGPTEPAKDPWGNLRVAVTATTKINRKDFGLTWNQALETGGVLVGDEVRIDIALELDKKP